MDDDLREFKGFAREYTFENRSYFDDGDIFFARAPGRLDVMGGIADYSGSLVLEMPIAEAALAAVQLDDGSAIQIVSLRTAQKESISRFTMPLDDLFGADGGPIAYQDAVSYFEKTAVDSWAAYIAGAFLVLMREKQVSFGQGARILIQSRVPEGKGVSSSAAVEVAAMLAIANAYGIALKPIELAMLCQVVENRVANAPCGIMDQMTVVNGCKDKLLALLCQPATIQDYIDVPSHFALWGIDSGIRHAVAGADYSDVRIGAFMGFKILQTISGESFAGYLANITPSRFEQQYRRNLPETILGSDFLNEYGELPDKITSVDPNCRYAVLQPTLHPIYEHFRVRAFAQLLTQNVKGCGPLLGELMYQSHASYSACGLGSSGTDRLVELVRVLGAGEGLFGAKITGGGSGGTVVVLGYREAEDSLYEIADRYSAATGYQPVVFSGSSDGAVVKD